MIGVNVYPRMQCGRQYKIIQNMFAFVDGSLPVGNFKRQICYSLKEKEKYWTFTLCIYNVYISMRAFHE